MDKGAGRDREIDAARANIEDARTRMTRIAEELARRSSSDYVRGRVRQAATDTGAQLKERAMASPLFFGIVGGAVSAALASAVNRRRSSGLQVRYVNRDELEVDEDVRVMPYEAGTYGYEEPRARGKAQEFRERASEKGHELRERGRERLQHAREAIPSRDEARLRASEWYHRQADEAPYRLALGALAAGAALGFLLPATERERQFAGPAKEKLRERVRGAAEEVIHKAEDSLNKAGAGTARAEDFLHKAEEKLQGGNPPISSAEEPFGAPAVSTPSTAPGISPEYPLGPDKPKY